MLRYICSQCCISTSTSVKRFRKQQCEDHLQKPVKLKLAINLILSEAVQLGTCLILRASRRSADPQRLQRLQATLHILLWTTRRETESCSRTDGSDSLWGTMSSPGASSNPLSALAPKRKTKKKHFVQQKVEVFRGSEPVLSVLVWGVNHSVRELPNESNMC